MKMLSCTCRRIVFLTHYFRSICLETNRSLLALLMLSSTFGSYAAPQRMEENLSLALPVVGAYQLRLLTPALLELTLVTTKAPDPAVLSEWDFVNASNQLLAPQPDRFQVQADGKILEVTAVGFKRRPLYAPLKIRDLRIGNYLYLQLAQPVSDGAFVRVLNPDATLWCSETDYSVQADPLRFSPAIHVHQEGYQPLWTKKAMIGYYLGSLGELTIPATSFCLVRVETSEVVFQGQLAARIDTGYTYTETPYQKVMEADFSEFETPGEYRLWVPGLGASSPFLISEGVGAMMARTYALGLYHQRCGTANALPYTRHVHGPCHTEPAQVPTMAFTAVQNFLASMTGDYKASQVNSVQLKNVEASLYPYVRQGAVDVSGGHHDAGDYSKYTINSAGMSHALLFAVDALPGVVELDNLGVPESGDGVSDVLQEAKWELDFLLKLQDEDGGFYFLVYPRERKYEDNVLPDQGDPQVVYPKNTAASAAAVGALAEAGSSPAMKRHYPEAARRYLEAAQRGWAFLEGAIATHGRTGAYQKLTHYGNVFADQDELAWAAAALYAATGDKRFEADLKGHYDPADRLTRRWTWWRLFEGYGCAARTYAFAARTGRLGAEELDPDYRARCEAEVVAAASDAYRRARDNAYGTSFPLEDKRFRSAGWYFSSERAFDLVVGYQLEARAEWREAVLSNLNYEWGCNPVNVCYVTGAGWKRAREVVHQYAQNDRRGLPPSGLPQGNIQGGFAYVDRYQKELGALVYPGDGATLNPYPYYDRWGDAFNTSTEFVIVDQARALAVSSWLMGQGSLKNQPWKPSVGRLTGFPCHIEAGQEVVSKLEVEDLNLEEARLIWETRGQEPVAGMSLTTKPNPGEQWIEVEATWPDGRRVFAAGEYTVTVDSGDRAVLRVRRTDEGRVCLHVCGPLEPAYVIEGSKDLKDWISVPGLIPVGPDSFEVDITDSPFQFFRLAFEGPSGS